MLTNFSHLFPFCVFLASLPGFPPQENCRHGQRVCCILSQEWCDEARQVCVGEVEVEECLCVPT